jgi:hypothetical protein
LEFQASAGLDAPSLNTGIFKNTKDLSLDQQQQLAAASMRIQAQTPDWYTKGAQQAQATGNYNLAAYLQRQAAERQAAEGKKALGQVALSDAAEKLTGNRNASAADVADAAASSYREQGYSGADARAMAERYVSEIAGKTQPQGGKSSAGLAASVNKSGGPDSSSGGSGSSGKEPEKADPLAAMQTILKLLQSNLPKIEKNTSEFAVLV